MRIAVAGLMHESNTFVRSRTDRASFVAGSLTFGRALIDEWKEAHHEVGGFIEGSRRFGYELEPVVMAWATPAGPVTRDVLDEVVDHIIRIVAQRVRRGDSRPPHSEPIDGLLLALHGAMVCDEFPDGDGEVLRRLREAFGPAFPIVVTLDFHANLSEQMVQNSTAIVFYQTNPHVDQRERGLRAAEIMARTVRGEIHPTQAMAKPATLITIACQNTSLAPMREFMAEARSLERQSGILSANISAGFPYADVFEMGPSVLIVTDGDRERAESEANRLSDKLFAARQELVTRLPEAPEAVVRAVQSTRHPVVLVEFGDNIGGGSPGDSTVVFSEIMRQKADGAVVAMFDPDAVQAAERAGIGSTLDLEIGGKTDRLHGDPVPVRAEVVSLSDGRWVEEQPRHGGRRFNDQGKTAVLRVTIPESTAVVTIVVNSKRTPPFSLGQLTSVGIDPARQKIIVVKAAIAYRAAYGPAAGEIIEVDTPGLTANDPRRFVYQRVRRPIYPLDAFEPARLGPAKGQS